MNKKPSLNKKINPDKNKIIYFSAIILSVAALILGYFYVSSKGQFYTPATEEYQRAKVTEIIDVEEVLDTENNPTYADIKFRAVILSGEQRGETVDCAQNIDYYAPFNARDVSLGDKIIIGRFGDGTTWSFVEYVRADAIIVLSVLFVLLLLVFGRRKGAKTVITLTLTLASVFLIFIPAVILGQNVYLYSVLICFYITVMTLVIVNGISPMSLAAMIGCIGGVLASAIITFITDFFIKLSGYTDAHSVYLLYIGDGLDLRALIFGSILVGSVGAVMDVAVDIAASLKELSVKLGKPSRRTLFTSGIAIGRDVIGTMSNTLILAYIGGSMCSIILSIYNYGASPTYLFNMEPIIVELLKILVGSTGILLTLPLTALVSAYIYTVPRMRDRLAREHRAEEGQKKPLLVVDEYTDILEAAIDSEPEVSFEAVDEASSSTLKEEISEAEAGETASSEKEKQDSGDGNE